MDGTDKPGTDGMVGTTGTGLLQRLSSKQLPLPPHGTLPGVTTGIPPGVLKPGTPLGASRVPDPTDGTIGDGLETKDGLLPLSPLLPTQLLLQTRSNKR